MAITIEARPNETIGIDDYLEHVEAEINSNDLDSVCADADAFAGLLNNPSLVADALNEELKGWRSFQTRNHYSAQTFLLGKSKHFVIRANVWTPPSSPDGAIREWEDKFYYYRVPHDHNFSFMTGGYYGSGYETVIYEYDYDAVVGEPGESVDLRFLEKTRLPKGKVMLYRASKDIHSQDHPDEFSISLNLLIVRPEDTLSTQYLFDLERCTVTGPVQNTAAAQTMLCSIAKHIGDDTTRSLLDDLSVTHNNPRFRFSCMDALGALSPANRSDIMLRMQRDAHPFVRGQADEGWVTKAD